MSLRSVTIAYAALRIAYAAALLAAPARTVRPWLGDAGATPGGEIAVRGLGGRDLVLSAGVALAAASGQSARLPLAACAASDAVDLGATLAADGDGLPDRSKLGTALAAGAFGLLGAALAVRHD